MTRQRTLQNVYAGLRCILLFILSVTLFLIANHARTQPAFMLTAVRMAWAFEAFAIALGFGVFALDYFEDSKATSLMILVLFGGLLLLKLKDVLTLPVLTPVAFSVMGASTALLIPALWYARLNMDADPVAHAVADAVTAPARVPMQEPGLSRMVSPAQSMEHPAA